MTTCLALSGLLASCSSPSTPTVGGPAQLDDEVAARTAPDSRRGEASRPTTATDVEFSCSRAPELLGRPGTEVELCATMAGVSSVYQVTLLDAAGGRYGAIVALDESGSMITERGPTVAGHFLRRIGAVSSLDLNPYVVTVVLDALGGFPEPFGGDDQHFEHSLIGTASVTTGPLRVELYHLMRDRSGRGDPGEGLYRRGVLAEGEDGLLSWRIDEGPPWRSVEVVPAEVREPPVPIAPVPPMAETHLPSEEAP